MTGSRTGTGPRLDAETTKAGAENPGKKGKLSRLRWLCWGVGGKHARSWGAPRESGPPEGRHGAQRKR